MQKTRNTPTRPGLSEPVHASQRIFKAALAAFSRPGRLVEVFDLPPAFRAEESSGGGSEEGRGFSRGMAALALALCDQDTPIWLDRACDDAETRHHLRFHCGSPLAAKPVGAAFAFIGEAARMPRLQEFSHGVPEYPDRSATLVIRARLGHGNDERFEFSGPGVRETARESGLACHIGGLPGWFRKSWQENLAGYPLGLDVVFVDNIRTSKATESFQIIGLPRGVSLEPARRPRVFNRPNRENVQCM